MAALLLKGLPLTFNQALVVDVLSAVAIHVWFNRYEPSASTTLLAFLTTFPLFPGVLLLSHLSLIQAFSLSYGLFYTSLLSSIILYRLSPFHPLAKYPGPTLGKISQLWLAWNALDGKVNLYMRRVHEKYGDVVRIGPNQLSIIDADLIPSILGVQGMPKGPLWEGRRITPSKDRGKFSLISSRDMRQHAQLRKPWSNAFTNASLKDYDEILASRATQLVESIEKVREQSNESEWASVDIARWISYFAFDFMGDLAFGGGFELMRDGDKEGIWQKIQDGLKIPGIAQHIPWFSHVLRALPSIGKHMRAFGAFAVQRAKIRAEEVQKGEKVRRDLFFYLLSAPSLSPNSEPSTDASPFPVIVSNAVLTIIAGSDTTASVLSNAVYYLLQNPDVLKKLRAELEDAFGGEIGAKHGKWTASSLDAEKLADLEYLNAVLNETMRLQPALMTALQRAPATGSGGKMIGSMYVPEGTAVQIPPYVLHRSAKYFSPDPNRFWPERWLQSEPDGLKSEKPQTTTKDRSPNDTTSTSTFTLDRTAFIPFSYGPMNCVGRPLALMELRLIIALLVLKFEMRFIGDSAERWEGELKDYFVVVKGSLDVEVRVRG